MTSAGSGRGASDSKRRRLPGHHLSGSRSAGVYGQRVRFLSHGGADEPVLKREHRNGAGLPAHTQHLEKGRTQSSRRSETHAYISRFCSGTAHLAVRGETRLCRLARLQEFGPGHAMLFRLVRHCAPSGHVVLFPGISTIHTFFFFFCKQVEKHTR